MNVSLQPAPGTELFRSPTSAHYPATYWFWHRVPTPREIRRQVQDMAAGGFRTFLIQPRLAFPLSEYLSEAYFHAYRLAVLEARQHGMQVGIYDEYAWQSGMAGGRTVEGADDLREAHVFWATAGGAGRRVALEISDIRPAVEALGRAGLAWQFEGGESRWGAWQILAAVSYPERIRDVSDIRDVTDRARLVETSGQGCRVEVSLPGNFRGWVTVFVFARSLTSRVPNYLMRQSAERFIAVTYEPLAQLLASELGTTVRFAFFDQPHATFFAWREHHGNLRTSLPYAEELGRRLTAKHAVPLGVLFLALVRDVGGSTRAIRCDVYEALSRLTQEAFLGTLHAWLRHRGLDLTGHEVLGHVNSWHLHGAFRQWDLRVNFGLDYFGVDAHRDVTAADAEGTGAMLSAKLADSAARAHGRRGCIVEQYFAGPRAGQYAGRWDLTLEALRAQIIRLHLHGARQYLCHAFYQTDGWPHDQTPLVNPRFDFAPGMNFEPWWPFHRALAEESARLSAFLEGGELVPEVAILFPLRTAWAEGPEHLYGEHVASWAEGLSRHGYSYLFVDERDLMAAQVQTGTLNMVGHAFRALVLPGVTTLAGQRTLDVIEKFAEAGGMILASEPHPEYSQDQRGDRGVAQAWQRLADRYANIVTFEGLPPWDREMIWPLRHERPWAEPSVWQWVGCDSEAWRVVLFNESHTPRSVTVMLPAPMRAVERWEPDTGRVSRVTPTDPADRLLVLLGPEELLCLRVMTEPGAVGVGTGPLFQLSYDHGPGQRRVWLDSGWTFHPAMDTGRRVAIDVSRGWEVQGFSTFSGCGVYECTFDLPDYREGSRWRLCLPAVVSAVEGFLNGCAIGRRGWAPYVFDVPAAILKPRGNQLELRVYNTAANHYWAGTDYLDRPVPSGLLAIPFLEGDVPLSVAAG
ncbi:MAG: carbohydrate-binding protein [Firmicutes bacterium]|nr:carbohydrate-binding protein [Bacillota bacterium]